MATVIAVPKVLRERLTDDGADALVKILNEVQDKAKTDVIELVEEKFERRLAEVESKIIKWTFVFIFGQFWAIVGVLFAFFRR